MINDRWQANYRLLDNYLVLFNKRHHSVQITVHWRISAKRLLLLLQPVQQGRHGVLELAGVQQRLFKPALSVHGLGAGGRPLSLQVVEHGLQGRFVRLRRLVFELLAGLHGLIVGGLFGGECLLELAVFR